MNNRKFITELKECLGEYYSEVREFFYNACVIKYDYKIFMARRSYVLYKIFSYVFDSIPEERLNLNTEFKIEGNIYNSNSLSQLIPLILNNNDSKILIIDDIIINGRTVNNIVEYLKNIGIKNFKIWCIIGYSKAKFLNKFKENLGHCRYGDKDDWNRLSNILTNLVVCSNFGYISFINSYISSELKIFNKLKNNELNHNNTNFYQKKHNIDSNVIFIKFKNYKDKLQEYRIKSCIRFYIKDKEITVIPYVFLPTLNKEHCYEYCQSLLSQFNIKIPTYYTNRNHNEFAKSLYQWTVYKLSNLLLDEFKDTYNIDKINNLSICSESYKFIEDDFENVNEDNDILKIKDYIIEDIENRDLIKCKGVFEKALNDKSNFNDNNINNEVLNNIFEQYFADMRELDEEKVNSSSNDYNRYKGIRIRDIIDIFNIYFPNIKDISSEIEIDKIIAQLLSNFDYGKAAYVIEEINVSNNKTEKDLEAIGGFVRHGEQAYRNYFELHSNVYNVFYELNRINYEVRKNKLILMAKYFDKMYNTEEFENFVINIPNEDDYFFAIKVIKPDDLPKGHIIVKNPKYEVNYYVKNYYNPN